VAERGSTSRVPFHVTAVVLILAATVACGDPSPGPGSVEVGEVEGVRVVTTLAPRWEGVRDLPFETLFSVGGSGAGGVNLTSIRAAVRLSDGGVVLLDGRSRQLVEYDGAGVFRRTLGRTAPCSSFPRWSSGGFRTAG